MTINPDKLSLHKIAQISARLIIASRDVANVKSLSETGNLSPHNAADQIERILAETDERIEFLTQ